MENVFKTEKEVVGYHCFVTTTTTTTTAAAAAAVAVITSVNPAAATITTTTEGYSASYSGGPGFDFFLR